jgi:hypothetical protein
MLDAIQDKLNIVDHVNSDLAERERAVLVLMVKG